MNRRTFRLGAVALGVVALLVSTSTAAAASTFVDVGDSVHAEAIEALAEDGIITGKSGDRFDPGGTLTRAQFASIIARAAELDTSGSAPFRDVQGSPHAGAIGAAVAEGIIQGYPDNTFRPSAPITRDQMAALIARWVEPPSTDEVAFTDLADTIHADAINDLAAIGVVRGTGDGTTFSPRAQVRRDQAASFVHRALGGGSGDGRWCLVNRWTPGGLILVWVPPPC